MTKFDFGNAFAHFANTGAPRGFVWKYALAYVAVQVVFFLLLMLFLGGLVAGLSPEAFGENPALVTGALTGTLGAAFLIILPISLLIYAVFDAAALRRYIRRDTFRLRLGGDEWRLFVVLLIWVAAYVGFFMLMSFAAIPLVGVSETVLSLLGLLVFFAYAYFATRFSPAAALTIRDRRIRFLGAWETTKGRTGWVLLGVYAVWLVIAILAYFVTVLVFASIASVMAGTGSATAAIAGFVFLFLFLAAGAAFFYIWAGPAALAARADGEDMNLTAEVFS